MSEETLLKIFSKNLKEIMKDENMTQEDLANEISVSRTMVSRYVTGQSLPSFVTVIKIADTLNYSVSDFLVD